MRYTPAVEQELRETASKLIGRLSDKVDKECDVAVDIDTSLTTHSNGDRSITLTVYVTHMDADIEGEIKQ